MFEEFGAKDLGFHHNQLKSFDSIPNQNIISSNQSRFFISIATYLKDFAQKFVEKVDFRKSLVPITMNI